MVTPLLTTKLYIPPVRPELVSRPRLIKRLNAGLHGRLTLISAPAGFGKTTLLSEWANQRMGESASGRRVAWVSLDKGDNDPTRFWSYFIAALQTIQVDAAETALGEAALETLRSSTAAFAAAFANPNTPSLIEALLSGLINEIAEIPLDSLRSGGSPRPFVLVLDDFHVITNQQIHAGITFLLDNLPPQMHLILASRADPPWPLARLRVRREMTELRGSDLRFTPEEAAAFLNHVMKLDLSPEDVAALEARTEGWITGLQMAAIAMQARLRQSPISMQERRRTQGVHDVSRFIQDFTGSHRFVLDYLVEEVLNQQSSSIQEFLLKTSVLDHLTAPLCAAVTGSGDSRTILTQLDQANLFVVPLDDERRWYRYHRLFADLLHSHLEQIQPDQVPALHLRASEWYEKNGLVAEAVGHALAAGDIQRVACLVEGNALATIYHGELTTLLGWLDALPQEVVHSRPWLCVAHAWILAVTGQFDAVEPLLQCAEDALAQSRPPSYAHDGFDDVQRAEGPVLPVPSTAEEGAGEGSEATTRHIAGHIAAIRAYAAAVRVDISRATELTRLALQYLPDEDWMVRSFATSLWGALLRWSGDFAAAARVWTELIAISQAADDNYGAVMALNALAALQIEQGQLHRAAATSRDALGLVGEYVRRGGRRLPFAGPVYARMSTLLRQWNDLEGAMLHAREALELSQQWGQAESLTTGYETLAKALQAIGDADGALSMMEKARQVASDLSPWYGAQLAALQARLWLAQGDVSAASRWAQQSGLKFDDELSFLRYEEYITFARLLVAQAKQKPEGASGRKRSLNEALELSARLLEAAEAAGATGRAIEALVIQAMALRAQGEADQALTALERALSLAEPEGYVRIFINEGAPMGALLRQAVVRGIAVDYVGKLLAAFSAEVQRCRGAREQETDLSPLLIERLSERELQVLRLLRTSLSSTEIAEELFIAPSTVRSHIKSIYGKLDVHSRREAVARARELDLL